MTLTYIEYFELVQYLDKRREGCKTQARKYALRALKHPEDTEDKEIALKYKAEIQGLDAIRTFVVRSFKKIEISESW